MKAARFPSIPPSLLYGGLYFIVAYLSLRFTSGDMPLAIWFPAGIGLAAVLLHGYLLLPIILLAAGSALWLNQLSLPETLLYSTGMAIEPAIAAALIRRKLKPHKLLAKLHHLLYFLLAGVVLAPLIGGLTQVALQMLNGASQVGELLPHLFNGWAADATGAILIVPLLLAPTQHSRSRNRTEALALALTLLAVCTLVFSGLLPIQAPAHYTAYLPLLVLAWAALRFRQQAAPLAMLVIAGFGLWGNTQGVGPFIDVAVGNSTLQLQVYLLALATTLLAVKAIINERSQIMERLSLASKIIAHTPDGVIVTDPRGIILSANPTFYKITGFKPVDTIGRSIQRLTSVNHSDDLFAGIWRKLRSSGAWEGEVWSRNRNGEVLPQWLNLMAITNDQRQPTHYLGVYSNIARQKKVQERIYRLAYYDALTSLPNRQLFADRLEQAIKYSGRHKNRVALFFLDLDRFKNINDSLGHSVGDMVLQLTAERLMQIVRQTDTLARIGGDEYAIVAQDIEEDLDAILIAEKVVNSFKLPLQAVDNELFLTPSIGIAMFPQDGTSSEDLIKKADTAMYRAKELGGNGFQFFAADMSDPVQRSFTIENALRKAIEQRTIQVAYQPQFDLRSGTIIGLEALARWHHNGSDDTPPGVFIKVAEETGLIHPLGELILEIACRQVVEWQQLGFGNLRMAVNISPMQLKQNEFSSRLRQIVDASGASPKQIELEITETTLMESAGFMENLLNLFSAQGFQIAVDDFGTGYSSLSYLKRLAINRIKIDQSFVKDLPGDANDAAICNAIISMAHNLKLKVIAEGVETKEQMDFLRRERCDEIQGYLFSKPIGADEVTEMIRQGYWHIDQAAVEI